MVGRIVEEIDGLLTMSPEYDWGHDCVPNSVQTTARQEGLYGLHRN